MTTAIMNHGPTDSRLETIPMPKAGPGELLVKVAACGICAKKDNSKGTRLAEYIQTIGIKSEQVVAIGDNYNDISMINFAGMGVTLSHAD